MQAFQLPVVGTATLPRYQSRGSIPRDTRTQSNTRLICTTAERGLLNPPDDEWPWRSGT